jgi:hypothetical protein
MKDKLGGVRRGRRGCPHDAKPDVQIQAPSVNYIETYVEQTISPVTRPAARRPDHPAVN